MFDAWFKWVLRKSEIYFYKGYTCMTSMYYVWKLAMMHIALKALYIILCRMLLRSRKIRCWTDNKVQMWGMEEQLSSNVNESVDPLEEKYDPLTGFISQDDPQFENVRALLFFSTFVPNPIFSHEHFWIEVYFNTQRLCHY